MIGEHAGAILSGDGLYRWLLWRDWNRERPLLIWIMLNPSTADATKNDRTVDRCVGFAERLGYGGIAVVNLYAWRATDPRELAHSDRRGVVGADNDRHIRDVVGGVLWPGRPRRVLAAWGATFQDRTWHEQRIADVRKLVEAAGASLWCLDVTAAGVPKHPLARGRSRIPDDATPVPWPLGRAE